jgi:hypothetical protein
VNHVGGATMQASEVKRRSANDRTIAAYGRRKDGRAEGWPRRSFDAPENYQQVTPRIRGTQGNRWPVAPGSSKTPTRPPNLRFDDRFCRCFGKKRTDSFVRTIEGQNAVPGLCVMGFKGPVKGVRRDDLF